MLVGGEFIFIYLWVGFLGVAGLGGGLVWGGELLFKLFIFY
jgi:hypothetical protein